MPALRRRLEQRQPLVLPQSWSSHRRRSRHAPSLMEELVQEILLRLPPEEPASLVRAALVCKPWRRLISSPSFRRRFLELHRTPPMLGLICNHIRSCSSFLSTTAASSPLHVNTSRRWCALDARHGRVLLHDAHADPIHRLVVWDPITDEQRKLPALPWRTIKGNAAVLCAATAIGACDHHGCQHGPFKVVFVGTEPRNMFVCTYSSDVDAWSEPISIQHLNDEYYIIGNYPSTMLLGNELYFGIPLTNTALKYDLELRETSWIELPVVHCFKQSCVFTTTDDRELRLVTLFKGILCIWVRMDSPKANARWTRFKAIDIGTQLDVLPVSIPSASVVGFADGLGVVFVTVEDTLYTVDLVTYVVKKQVYSGKGIETVFPYMRFYSPALEAASLGAEDEPSAAGSSA